MRYMYRDRHTGMLMMMIIIIIIIIIIVIMILRKRETCEVMAWTEWVILGRPPGHTRSNTQLSLTMMMIMFIMGITQFPHQHPKALQKVEDIPKSIASCKQTTIHFNFIRTHAWDDFEIDL